MLHHMFYFGVILPTTLVILFFILFLICWFKCGLRERFTSNTNSFQKGGSHNSTQSSLVTTSSGLPYANGPPSKDYWEIDVEHDTKVDKKEPKYIPGEFSTRSDDWIYMSHDHAQTVTGSRSTESAQVHVWSGRSGTSSPDSQASKPGEGQASPKEISVSSNRSSPAESVTKLGQDMTLPLRVVDSSSIRWRMIPNPDNLPHYYPSTAAGFEFIDRQAGHAAYLCSPYAITNLIQPPAAPAIRV